VVAERITSTANPRVKAFAKLNKARERQRTGLFLVEGYREIQRAVAAGVEVETLLVCPDLLTNEAHPLVEGLDAADSLDLDEAPFRKVAFRENPPGVIAVARQFDTVLTNLWLGDRPLILVIEQVEKPGNLGAMMRTADAVGVDAVIVADAATDVFNPNVVRASQGSLFSVPLAVATTGSVALMFRLRSTTTAPMLLVEALRHTTRCRPVVPAFCEMAGWSFCNRPVAMLTAEPATGGPEPAAHVTCMPSTPFGVDQTTRASSSASVVSLPASGSTSSTEVMASGMGDETAPVAASTHAPQMS
jgi:TrmH family RNA methyltransferase